MMLTWENPTFYIGIRSYTFEVEDYMNHWLELMIQLTAITYGYCED